jgi:hypothetical protein
MGRHYIRKEKEGIGENHVKKFKKRHNPLAIRQYQRQ